MEVDNLLSVYELEGERAEEVFLSVTTHESHSHVNLFVPYVDDEGENQIVNVSVNADQLMRAIENAVNTGN